MSKRGHKIAEDLTGRTFNRLTVLRRAKTEPNRCIRWVTVCTCGKEVTARSHSLKSGETKSCGCWRKESRMLQAGISMRNQLLKAYQLSAQRRGYEWFLTDEMFFTMTQTNCYYCGAEPSSTKRSRRSNGTYVYNGIDRVKNDLSYIASNVVTCCTICNYAKRTLSHDVFIEYLRRAGAYQSKRGIAAHV